MNKPYRVNLLGCPVDNISFEETLGLIDEMIQSRTPHQHVVINVDKLLKTRRDKKLREVVSDCDIINADGVPVVWASRILGKPLKERVAGIDLMEKLVEISSKNKYRLFFLGAEEEVVKKTVEIFKTRYPGIVIAGSGNGYWPPSREEEVAARIKDSKPDILFVAVSSPKKEIFIKRHLGNMKVPFVMGVGGAFDVIAGRTSRAPVWMQRCGLEWLYRLMQEPGRMWKRYLTGNTLFVFLVFREWIKKGLADVCAGRDKKGR